MSWKRGSSVSSPGFSAGVSGFSSSVLSSMSSPGRPVSGPRQEGPELVQDPVRFAASPREEASTEAVGAPRVIDLALAAPGRERQELDAIRHELSREVALD